MVKVLLCHYFRSQRVFSDSFNPTSLHASRQFIFIGVEGCRVFVYCLDQPNFPVFCQFSTISTAVKLISNDAGNYVASIERRQQREAVTYARVYFNWERASKNEAVRVVVAGYSSYQRNNEDSSQQFFAVELPSRTSITALACCKNTGNIIIACDGKLSVYRLCSTAITKPEVEAARFSCDLEHLIDIEPGVVIRGVDICDHFIAFRSKLEARAIKLVFPEQALNLNIEGERENNKTQANQRDEEEHKDSIQNPPNKQQAVTDDECVYWEFDKTASSPHHTNQSSPLMFDEVLFRTVRTESCYVDTYSESKEILGPMTEVRGHPLKVGFAGRFGIGINVGCNDVNVCGVTMLYRRFRKEQLCNSDSGIGALHSLQLLPTYTKGLPLNDETVSSPLVSFDPQQPLLGGMCVMVSGPKEGYVYDIYNKAMLLSQYKYTSDTIKVSVCHTLLHAITKQGLETYTVRMYAAASQGLRTDRVLQHNLSSMQNEKKESKIASADEGSDPGSTSEASAELNQVLETSCTSSVTSSMDGSLSSFSKEFSLRESHQGFGPLGSEYNQNTEADYTLMQLIRSAPFSTRQERQILNQQLPIHELQCLLQICPSPTLDICLIGMHPFVDLAYLLCSGEDVVLFTRATHDLPSTRHGHPNPNERPIPEWAIYVLHSMDPLQLYKAMMPLANRCQRQNPQAYYHLVCEQQLLLRSSSLLEPAGVDEGKRKKIRKLLTESALNLASICSKVHHGEANLAADYYEMTGLPLWEVVNRAWNVGPPYGPGMAEYLDRKLFGPDEPVTVSESTSKRIFRIYSRVKPSRVSEIVLTSSLNGFSPETAIHALEDLKKVEDSSYKFTPIDKLVLSILYLHQCEPYQARSELVSIKEEELVQTLSVNYFLLHEDLKHLTPLAQLLRKHTPVVFLEIMLLLHNSKKLPQETILSLLGVNKPDAYRNSQVLKFLESILNDKKQQESFQTIAALLARIYLYRIMENQKTTRSVSVAHKTHSHVPKGDGYFGQRLPWLDKISPFSEATPAPSPNCPVSMKTSGQSSPRLTRHLARPMSPSTTKIFARSSVPFTGHHVSPGGGTDSRCTCCCCTEDLLKIQSLLSSSFADRALCETMLTEMNGKEFAGDLSIRLLCYPRLDQHKKAVAQILQKCSSILLQYCQDFFQVDLAKWSYLLTVLLEHFQKPVDPEILLDTDDRRVLLGTLKGTLSRLAELTSPPTLLALLPDEGDLGFFLPYLEQCYRRCTANKLNRRLHTGSVSMQAKSFS
ncbi:Hermansky-Pudlak syndrome 3 protein [Nematostella vectensis]|uniref:Hermansky-Pudlak syndrome 3 protein n=1 Tax=Nematostella vectensis TaxID=45351 RepID=UPI00207716BC|nr:Hermansky-Pudlak syndrome 3 protein [Nematostella vectensis]